MSKNTQELLNILKNTNSIASYIQNESTHFSTIPLSEYLEKLLVQKNLKKSQCIEAANLQRNYGYQIFSGERIPSRDKVIALCFAMQLTPEESHSLLCSAGYPDLYPKNKRDSILIFGLTKKLSLLETNELLFEFNENILD